MANSFERCSGICVAVDEQFSYVRDNATKDVVMLRNGQLEKFGTLPDSMKQGSGLLPGIEAHFIRETGVNGLVKNYLDRDYYFERFVEDMDTQNGGDGNECIADKDSFCVGSDNIFLSNKRFWKSGIVASEGEPNPGFYNHVKVLSSFANARMRGDLWLGVDSQGYAIGIDELDGRDLSIEEAQFRNYVKMSTGNTLFAASLKITWLREKGRDGQFKQLCHITIPEWRGKLPIFAGGDTVFLRISSSSVKLRFNDLKEYIENPDLYLRTLKNE